MAKVTPSCSCAIIFMNIINDNESLSLFHFNIRSLEYNLVHLEALLSNLLKTPDIIALTETWLNQYNMDNFFIEGYNAFHIVREPNEHGGVSLFVRDGLQCEKIDEFSYRNSLIEICSIKLLVSGSSYTIAAIYRPSDKYKCIKEFRKELAPILKNPIFKKENSIIIGDLNIDLLLHSEHQETNEYLNLLQTFSYISYNHTHLHIL